MIDNSIRPHASEKCRTSSKWIIVEHKDGDRDTRCVVFSGCTNGQPGGERNVERARKSRRLGTDYRELLTWISSNTDSSSCLESMEHVRSTEYIRRMYGELTSF